MITTPIILSCQNNSFLINDTPLLIIVVFNVALFAVTLFNPTRFDAALIDVKLF